MNNPPCRSRTGDKNHLYLNDLDHVGGADQSQDESSAARREALETG